MAKRKTKQHGWHIQDTPELIVASIAETYPKIEQVLDAVRGYIPGIKLRREISEYQAAALYYIVRQFLMLGTDILEIGTAHGYSAAIMAEATKQFALDSHLITLNPRSDEAAIARINLARYSRVLVHEESSWDLLRDTHDDWGMVFIDGDHKHIMRDLPWLDKLIVGGIVLFHDYSPAGTWRECPPVFEAVNHLSHLLGREPDILVRDDRNVGMAGFLKRKGDKVTDIGLVEAT